MHQTRSHGRAISLAIAVFIGASLLPATGAGAQASWDVEVAPDTSERSQPTFSFQVTGDFPTTCVDVTHEVFANGGGFVDPSMYTLTVASDDLSGTGSLSNALPDTAYGLRVTCDFGQGQTSSETDFLVYNRLTVEKAVEGSAPAGTAFTARVQCDPEPPFEPIGVDTTVGFGETGGSELVVLYERGMTCTVTEPNAGGADSVAIAPETAQFGVEGPYEITSVITNTFEAATSTSTTTTSTTTTTTTTAPPPDSGPVPEAAPADPVEADPTYTG